MTPINKTLHPTQSEALTFHTKATTDDRLRQRETAVDALQGTILMLTVSTSDKEEKSESLMFSLSAATTKDEISTVLPAPKIDTGRGGCETVQSIHISQQVASSRLNIRDNQSDQLVWRCPPERNLDPVSTFMMLRAQQTASVNATPQNLASSSGLTVSDGISE